MNVVSSKVEVVDKSKPIAQAKLEPKNENAVALLKKFVSSDHETGHSENTADCVREGEGSVMLKKRGQS